MKAKIEIFTSPTCPYCPRAVQVAEELGRERDDIKIIETSTYSHKGSRRAENLGVRSVPTLFITGPGYPDRIGYIGAPSKEKLGKMVNIALGKEQWEQPEGLLSRLMKIKIKI